MITLNDYLYDDNTVLKILHLYEADLRQHAKETGNEIDLIHSNFLLQIIGLWERNDFLTYQSQRIREFYQLMTREYPHLAFTFRGRIKSLVRAESKFNAYVIEYISDYYREHGELPPTSHLKQRLSLFRDLIAYRFVISLPHCHLQPGEDPEETELKYLYEIADRLPAFMEERGFTPELVTGAENSPSPLSEHAKLYFRDYVAAPSESGYRSLHITLFDNIANCYTEVQVRTKQMDDHAVIGPANHFGYEQRQNLERSGMEIVPPGLCPAFDEAVERQKRLQDLDLASLRVNMFTAYSQDLVNDGCGLCRGRLIMPFEHLSRFQNDVIG